MQFFFLLIFAILAFGAIGFAVWPIIHGPAVRGRALLIGAIAAPIMGLGLGSYLLLGSPSLAVRSLTGPQDNDVRSLVATLARRMVRAPDDARGWALLGRGYLTLNDPSDAAQAFKRALGVAAPQKRGELLSAYGEALTLAANGAVPPEAQAAFAQAFSANPHDNAARLYLGQVAVQRGDRAQAVMLWQSLLADLPPDHPLHAMLVDRIAALSAQSGAAPDIHAMVEGLAARLKSNPKDAEGWQRLVRAYSVLGEKDKARAALADGRAALKSDSTGLAALNAEAERDRL